MSLNRLKKTKNTIRNIISGFLSKGVSLVLPFLVRTIVLRRFGTEYLGLNSVFYSVISVLNLAELGFSASVVYSLYKPVAENDTDTVCAYLAYFRIIYRNIGLFVGIAGVLMMPFLPFLVKDTVVPGNLNLYIWYLIILSDPVLSYLVKGYKTVIPTAVQRNDILSVISIVTVIVKSTLQIIVLYLGRTFYAYLLVLPLSPLIHNLFLSYQVEKQFPEYVPRGMITDEQKKQLRPILAGLLIHKVRAISRNGFDSICLSAFIGLAAAGIYENYLYVMTMVISMASIITSSMLSGIGNSIVTDSKEKNYQDMCKFDFMYMTLAGWASICMLCLYQPFMKLWAGEVNMLGLPEVIGFVLYFYVLCVGNIRWLYLEGAGLWWESRYVAIAESVGNLVLNILLVRWLGVLGIILGTLISLIIADNIFGARIVFDHYFQNGKLSEYFRNQLTYLLVSTVIAIPVYLFSTVIPSETVIMFVVKGIICAFLPIGLYYLIYRRFPQFQETKMWIKQHLKHS